MERYLKNDEAAALLGTDVPTFMRRVKLGQVRKFGERLRGGRYLESDVIELRDRLAASFEPKHLYVIEFVNRCVKIGITSHPLKRLSKHFGDAKKFGLRVGRVWVSAPHREAQSNEVLLKAGSRSEYLSKKFETVMADVLSLPFTRVEVSRV